MSTLSAVATRTFSALSVRNYRRYFFGQSASQIGTQMQVVAQSWLVFSITGSSTAIGVVLALQNLPVLLLAPYGGLMADRFSKRRLLIVLQSLMGIQALALGLLVVSRSVQLWEIFFLAGVLGLNSCFEIPARQSFVLEMVGRDRLRNAVSLNSTMVNAARTLGPACAGLLIATLGTGPCFLINALSFGAVVYSLASMDPGELNPSQPTLRAPSQLRQGLQYVISQPRLAVPLLMVAIVGTLAWEFQVTLPVLAKQTFDGGAATYGFLTASMGAGAVLGGLMTATRGRTGVQAITVACAVFGTTLLLASASPTLLVAYLTLAGVGYASVSYFSTTSSTLQLESLPSMRGRVMSLWAMAMLGSTPVGGPLIGWVVSVTDARLGLAIGGLACFAAVAIGGVSQRNGGDSKSGSNTSLPALREPANS